MNEKKEVAKGSQQSQKNEDFPYKVVFYRNKGIYIGRPANDMQLIYLKPLSRFRRK